MSTNTAPKHYVVFGFNLLSDAEIKWDPVYREVSSWDLREAIEVSETVRRNGTSPVCFRFSTPEKGSGSPISYPAKISELYFLGGTVRTLEALRESSFGTLTEEEAYWFVWNMVMTPEVSIAIVTRNRSLMYFQHDDLVIDARGEIIDRGDAPKYVAYREARRAAEASALREFARFAERHGTPIESLKEPGKDS